VKSTIFYGNGNENHELGAVPFVHKRIISAVKRTEYVSDRMSYEALRGRWCDSIVPNVHAPTKDKIDDMKVSFNEEPERIFHKFPKYHMKIMLYLNAEVGGKDIFQSSNCE
jgi:hypothetical protein